ncbi:hypothetical protein JHN52_01120 [Streptomyces sp. MBT97]|uniref:hypothetical protein n=1 Tax=Streptomyces sp. MBT97 TaxID=2800411 RepID=UPI00190C5B28|nr:hypothetical protein [Streptomyces sp. MBT97]MBK3631582.1 hypothetical protein [Streptomyces sp. MBT97]
MTVLFGVFCAASACGAALGLARQAPRATGPVTGTVAFILVLAAAAAAMYR